MHGATIPTVMFGMDRASGDDCYPGLGKPPGLAVDLFDGLEEQEPEAPAQDEAGAADASPVYESITLEASPVRIAQLRADAAARDGWRIKL